MENQNAMQSALDKIKSALLSPEVKKTSKEQIKEKVKPSILARLERNKELAKQEMKQDGANTVRTKTEYGALRHLPFSI